MRLQTAASCLKAKYGCLLLTAEAVDEVLDGLVVVSLLSEGLRPAVLLEFSPLGTTGLACAVLVFLILWLVCLLARSQQFHSVLISTGSLWYVHHLEWSV